MKQLILIIFVISSLIFPQDLWELIPSGTNEQLNAINFFDETKGMIVGNNGIILKTTDAGETWEEQLSGTTHNLNAVYLTGNNSAIIVGESSTVLNTTDGGTSWNSFNFNSNKFTDVSFCNKDTGVIVSPSGLYITHDGGNSWLPKITIKELPYPVKGCFIDDTTIIVLQGYSKFSTARSTNGGSTFDTTIIDGGLLPLHISGLKFLNSKIGYALGYFTITSQIYNYLFKTTDGGKSWNFIPSKEHIRWESIFILNENFMVVSGAIDNFTKGVYYSFDDGVSWKRSPLNINSSFLDIHFTDRNNGILIGREGTIMKTTKGVFHYATSINNFKYSYKNGYVQINWDAKKDSDFNSFELQRKSDSLDWESILISNDKTHKQTYSVNDTTLNPSSRNLTYRIKVTFTDSNSFFIYANQYAIIFYSTVSEFKCIPTINYIGLTWKGITEVNFSKFEIEKLNDQYVWMVIGEINKNNNIENSFLFIDSSYNKEANSLKYRIKIVNIDGSFSYSEEKEVKIIQPEYRLEQNYPNPFNPTTTIEYSIPERTNVTLKIFDILGREITTLVNEEKSIGNYKVDFNASSLPSGIYLFRLKAGKFNETRKLILIR